MLKKATFLPARLGASRRDLVRGKAAGAPVLTHPELRGQLFLHGYAEDLVEPSTQPESCFSIRLHIAV